MWISILLLVILICVLCLLSRPGRTAHVPPRAASTTVAAKENTLWLYWENIPGKQKPNYIELCHETIKKNAHIPTWRQPKGPSSSNAAADDKAKLPGRGAPTPAIATRIPA